MNQAIVNDLNKQMEELKQKISGLQNVSRLVNNNLSILGETDIKGAYAKPVAEIQDWLQGFDAQVKGQIAALQGLLPKEAPVESKAPETAMSPVTASPVEA